MGTSNDDGGTRLDERGDMVVATSESKLAICTAMLCTYVHELCLDMYMYLLCNDAPKSLFNTYATELEDDTGRAAIGRNPVYYRRYVTYCHRMS